MQNEKHSRLISFVVVGLRYHKWWRECLAMGIYHLLPIGENLWFYKQFKKIVHKNDADRSA